MEKYYKIQYMMTQHNLYTTKHYLLRNNDYIE